MLLLLLVVAVVSPANGYCPRGCECDNKELWVKCTNFRLEMVPITLNPHITRFNIQNSNISVLREGFQFYEALLDLDFSNNRIHSIEDSIFSKQVRLSRLSLSHNRLVKLKTLTLAGLKGLQSLDLSHNYIESLEASWLQHCPNLTHLNLNRNNLVDLQATAFAGANSLNKLWLSRNLLSLVPDLEPAPNIQTLDLSNNPLDAFSLCSLSFLSQLRDLNISGTGLTRLEPCPHTFRSVLSLDISRNYLSLPLAELLALPNLRHISAGQRNISILSKTSFVGLDNLRSVQVANSPKLTGLETGLFASLQYLENLTLRSNPGLEYLPVGLLLAGDKPLRIIARDNGLRWLDPGSLPWERVSLLDLSNNSLHCDCAMAWMISAGLNLTATCSSPAQFTGLNVQDLDQASFQCVLLGPVEVSVLSVCLVLVALSLGVVGFLVYRHRMSSGGISDLPGPGYLQHYKGACKLGWPDKMNYSEGDWTYLEPKCSCREMYELPLTRQTNLQNLKCRSQTMDRSHLSSLMVDVSTTNLDISSTTNKHKTISRPFSQDIETMKISDYYLKSPGLLRRDTAPTLLDPSDYFLPQTDDTCDPRREKCPISEHEREVGGEISKLNTGYLDRNRRATNHIYTLKLGRGEHHRAPRTSTLHRKYLNLDSFNTNVRQYNQSFHLSQDHLEPSRSGTRSVHTTDLLDPRKVHNLDSLDTRGVHTLDPVEPRRVQTLDPLDPRVVPNNTFYNDRSPPPSFAREFSSFNPLTLDPPPSPLASKTNHNSVHSFLGHSDNQRVPTVQT